MIVDPEGRLDVGMDDYQAKPLRAGDLRAPLRPQTSED